MSNNLESLSGGFKNTTKVDLSAYNTFCKNQVSWTQNIQAYVIATAKHVQDYVMVEGKWYDDCAANFAQWWNDVKGSMDGVDAIHRISTEAEELFEITVSKLSKALADPEGPTGESVEKRSDCDQIRKMAKTDKYNVIRDLKKADLGRTKEEECRPGTVSVADPDSLRALVKFVGENLKNIDERIDDIRKGVMDVLLTNAVVIPDFNADVLNQKVNTVKNRLRTIQSELYGQLSKDQNYINRSDEFVRTSLGNDFKIVKS